MKRIGLFLMCLLCAPYVAHAADHCTNPDEYTVDKRCYVTDEQKQEKPYNAVVGVSVDGDYSINCTGTIVKNGDEFFLYTAKHCVAKKDSNGIIKNKVRIKFQNGKETIVEFVVAGDKRNRWDSDWVVYRLLPNYVTENLFGKVRYRANENMEDTIDYVYADDNGFCDGRHVTSVGYGSLKIMSDKDIEKFKQRYLNYLERKGITLTDENRLENGISHDGNTVLNTSEGLVDKFIHGFIREVFYTGWIFDDSKLSGMLHPLLFTTCFIIIKIIFFYPQFCI